jgi:hypothetical protein
MNSTLPFPTRSAIAIALGGVLLLVSPAVSAQPSMVTPTNHSDHEEKSPGTALALSLGVTALGFGAAMAADSTHSEGLGWLGAAGIMFGPNAGHWYAGDFWTPGLGMRLGGGALASIGLMMALSEAFDDWGSEDEYESGDDPSMEAAGAMFLVGSALFVSGAVYDIATAPRAARRHNERSRRQISVAPTLGRENVGLVVAGRF